MSKRTVLVAGGAGFIGSHFVEHVLKNSDMHVVVLDKLTYAGRLENLSAVEDDPRFSFVRADICDGFALRGIFATHCPMWVINFAAETHVDRSIGGPRVFVNSNVVGAFELLEAAREYHSGLQDDERSAFKFVHVSTDEVYGSLGQTGFFTEETPYAPNSPYSASKAASDHMARAYHSTYGLPVCVTNCSNNYGPRQFPEKLIPLMLLNALCGRDLPIYGTGSNVRDWLHVEDHCTGLLRVLQVGRPGERYNFGGGAERTNLQVIDKICELLEERRPAAMNSQIIQRGLTAYGQLKKHVVDRLGHDARYAIDANKASRELNFSPRYSFEDGMAQTVDWYLSNPDWCKLMRAGC